MKNHTKTKPNKQTNKTNKRKKKKKEKEGGPHHLADKYKYN